MQAKSYGMACGTQTYSQIIKKAGAKEKSDAEILAQTMAEISIEYKVAAFHASQMLAANKTLKGCTASVCGLVGCQI